MMLTINPWTDKCHKKLQYLHLGPTTANDRQKFVEIIYNFKPQSGIEKDEVSPFVSMLFDARGIAE